MKGNVKITKGKRPLTEEKSLIFPIQPQPSRPLFNLNIYMKIVGLCFFFHFWFVECKSGEVVVTQAYKLPAKLIIHTVGPKYNLKFQTAAENALHMCYR